MENKVETLLPALLVSRSSMGLGWRKSDSLVFFKLTAKSSL